MLNTSLYTLSTSSTLGCDLPFNNFSNEYRNRYSTAVILHSLSCSLETPAHKKSFISLPLLSTEVSRTLTSYPIDISRSMFSAFFARPVVSLSKQSVILHFPSLILLIRSRCSSVTATPIVPTTLSMPISCADTTSKYPSTSIISFSAEHLYLALS